MSRSTLRRTLEAGGVLAAGLAGAAGATVAWSRFVVDHRVSLPDAVDAPRRTVSPAGCGDVSYYADESVGGRPLILLHSLNAAASAFEMRPLFEAFRGSRPVIMPDLPGFGFSRRGPRGYTPPVYQTAIESLLARHAVSGGADIVALSTSCEHAALAATDVPELVRSMIFISPTGFASTEETSAPERKARRGEPRSEGLLARSSWLAQTVFDLLTTRTSIRYYLSRTLAGSVSDEMVDYAYATAHQPGARFAPLSFLRGDAFVRDVGAVYAGVTQPTLVLFDRDAYSDYARVPEWVMSHPNWAAQRIPGTRGLPQLDAPDRTARAIAHWLSAMENLRHLGVEAE